jgi:hypothetical protein
MDPRRRRRSDTDLPAAVIETMSAANLDTGTWSRRKDAVAWSFDLHRAEDETPSQALVRAATRLLRCLPGFATPHHLKWTTLSGGENVAALDAAQIDEAAVVELGERFPDVVGVVLGLDLIVADDAGTEGRLPNAAIALLELDDEQPYLSLSLHTDIYAKRTFAPNPDNQALAAINAPRLRGFLEQVRDRLGGSLNDLTAGGYHGQVGPLGFE